MSYCMAGGGRKGKKEREKEEEVLEVLHYSRQRKKEGEGGREGVQTQSQKLARCQKGRGAVFSWPKYGIVEHKTFSLKQNTEEKKKFMPPSC